LDLTWNLLPAADVARERGEIAVEEHHDQGRPPYVEAARNREQHALVAVGQVFPIDAAAQRGMAAPLAVDDVEESDPFVRHRPAVGERRGVEWHELDLGSGHWGLPDRC